ncbi:hypothetical protein [Marinibacterium sp. SX1]|uniref:hypothetical protein n=1 Tax=Marinibacterium sp. SX1 TaxID=3388424 RepID=UPI003D178579
MAPALRFPNGPAARLAGWVSGAVLFLLSLALLWLSGGPSQAQQPDNFVSTRDEIYSSPRMMTEFDHIMWGTGRPRDRDPGLWAAFRAQPDPNYPCQQQNRRIQLCDNRDAARCSTGGGSVQVDYPPDFAKQRTGLDTDQVFMPMCPSTGMRGDAFVALSQAEDAGGIGLYLRSGTGEGGTQAFMQVSPHTANADVQGIYINFRSVYLKPKDWMRPFHGAGTCRDQACREGHKLQVTTDQTYAMFDNNGMSGVVQIFRFLIRNSNGTPNLRDDGVLNIGMRTFCNHASVARDGVGCPDRVSIDPKQGATGQHYYSGQFGAKGSETQVRIAHDLGPEPHVARLWTTLGAPTSDAPFTDQRFRATISWPQFVSMLRGVAYRAGQDGSTDAGVAAVFGPGWAEPDNWFVQSVRFGQELKNTNWNGAMRPEAKGAGSGGSMEWFSLKALKP